MLDHNTADILEELDEQNQEVEFRELMTNSVWYVLLNRCGLDVQEYLDAEDFRHITDFNQLKILGHLGSAAQRDQQTSPDADWTICSE